jgi:hypothetical protein
MAPIFGRARRRQAQSHREALSPHTLRHSFATATRECSKIVGSGERRWLALSVTVRRREWDDERALHECGQGVHVEAAHPELNAPLLRGPDNAAEPSSRVFDFGLALNNERLEAAKTEELLRGHDETHETLCRGREIVLGEVIDAHRQRGVLVPARRVGAAPLVGVFAPCDIQHSS